MNFMAKPSGVPDGVGVTLSGKLMHIADADRSHASKPFGPVHGPLRDPCGACCGKMEEGM